MSEETTTPSPAGAPDRLTSFERRRVRRAAAAAAGVVAVAIAPVALLTDVRAREAVGALVLYGGLLAVVTAFVTVSRQQARQCPACHRRHDRTRQRCACGYDLASRPRYACERRHRVYLGPGECACGRGLHRLPTARGLASQTKVAVRIAGGLLAFLAVAVGAAYLVEGRI